MSINIDYQAMLADMEARRDALNRSIDDLRLGLGLGPGGDNAPRPSQSGSSSQAVASDLPKGALLNKSIPDAIKLYLKSVAAKRTSREITDALQAHGVVSLASNFSSVVFTALKRLQQSKEVLQFEDGWGLAEFYPAHIRAAMTDGPPSKVAAKKKKAKAKAKAKAQASKPTPEKKADAPKSEPTPEPAEGTQDGIEPRVEQFVNTLESPLSGAEIAKALGLKGQTVGLLLAKLASKGRITKTEDKKFGPKNNVQEMPKAS